VSYCCRAQNRPTPRRRSCRACNAAKAKCSFGSPCSRCLTKGLECLYGHSIAILSASSGETNMGDRSSLAESSRDQDALLGQSLLSADILGGPYGNAGLRGVTRGSSLAIDQASYVWEASIDSQTDGCRDSMEFGCLTRLRKPHLVAEHDAGLIVDALCAIPGQMTRRETFPCFIHPHWNRNMPESLTICMHLAQTFASRSQDIKPFLWRSILAEQRRVMQQVSRYRP